MEFHLAIKKNERFLFAVTWVDLEGIMLSEIKQRNQLYVCDINFMWSLIKRGFPGSSVDKESCNAGDPVQSLGRKDPLEEGIATHSSILA